MIAVLYILYPDLSLFLKNAQMGIAAVKQQKTRFKPVVVVLIPADLHWSTDWCLKITNLRREDVLTH